MGICCVMLLVCCIVLLVILRLHEQRLRVIEAECDDLRRSSESLAELSMKYIRHHE